MLIEGEPTPASVIAGGGNLRAIVDVAAEKWEHLGQTQTRGAKAPRILGKRLPEQIVRDGQRGLAIISWDKLFIRVKPAGERTQTGST